MSSTEEGFTLHVTVTIAPENVPQFLEAFTPAYKAVVAEPEVSNFLKFMSQSFSKTKAQTWGLVLESITFP